MDFRGLNFVTRLVITMAVLLGGIAAHAQTEGWSKRIKSRTEHPLASLINPHVDPVNVLIIDGRRFDHVRGVEKFYLPAPKASAIIFVTDHEDYSMTYHVFKMDTGEDIAIPSRGSLFGNLIGYPESKDVIEEFGTDEVVLSTRTGPNIPTKTFIRLSLKQKAVLSEKTLFYDKAGNVISEHTTPGG